MSNKLFGVLIAIIILAGSGFLVYKNISQKNPPLQDQAGTVDNLPERNDASNLQSQTATATSSTGIPLGTSFFNNSSQVSPSAVGSVVAAKPTGQVHYVMLGAGGFIPKSLEIKKGEAVVFINNSDEKMWIASYSDTPKGYYPGFDEMSIAIKGQSYRFTFEKAGTWKFRNNLNTAEKGTIIVK